MLVSILMHAVQVQFIYQLCMLRTEGTMSGYTTLAWITQAVGVIGRTACMHLSHVKGFSLGIPPWSLDLHSLSKHNSHKLQLHVSTGPNYLSKQNLSISCHGNCTPQPLVGIWCTLCCDTQNSMSAYCPLQRQGSLQGESLLIMVWCAFDFLMCLYWSKELQAKSVCGVEFRER